MTGFPTGFLPYSEGMTFVDADHPDVVAFAARATAGAGSDREKAVALFYAVRDGIRYDPYALSADPQTGELFDYFGGLVDLQRRHIRFIGDPLQRIAEDHLRILRFFRFHARFGAGQPDAAALEACSARANDLMALSRERIADEILKLLSVSETRRPFAASVTSIPTSSRRT